MTTPFFLENKKCMLQQQWSLNCLYSGNQTIQMCGNFEWFTRNALLGLVICCNGPSTTVAFSVQKVPFEGVVFFHGRSFFWWIPILVETHHLADNPRVSSRSFFKESGGFAPRMAIIHVVLLPMSPCFRRSVFQHGNGWCIVSVVSDDTVHGRHPAAVASVNN